MKSNTKPNHAKEIIFLMDDEPQYLSWLVEYLESKGYAVETASNLGEAMQKLEPGKYRTVIADLSVPIPSEMRSLVEAEGKAYLDFPGLYLAHHARNIGYRNRQVVVYSVHDSATVAEVAARIGVCYITKGRPKMLKDELDNILSYDPTRG
jgi:CheY-like chemotaxis protein